MIHPTIAQALRPFAPVNSQLNDPIRRDEAREQLADVLDDWYGDDPDYTNDWS